jgi:hypothetical protein
MEDRVSRKALIAGPANIILGGKTIIQAGQSLLPTWRYACLCPLDKATSSGKNERPVEPES